MPRGEQPERPAPNRLRDHEWPRFLSAPDPSLVRELYEPALSLADRYDRCCAFFSSSVLSAAARGFGSFIERLLALGDSAPRPAMRLLVNEELQERDVNALMERRDTAPLEQLLLSRLGEARTALELRRLEMLTWLYHKGLLDIRVGIMRQSLGVLHAKFGLMIDSTGDSVVFAGSDNESETGLRGNYEQVEISGSWTDPERAEHYRNEFERLWLDRHPDVSTFELPEAVRERLIRLAPAEPPVRGEERLYRDTLEAAMRWQFIAEAPYLVGPAGAAACDATAFVTPWPHQVRVVAETVAAWPDGRLLCDEVGMGKTIEAILILRRLLFGRGVRRALLLLPAGIQRQWQDELREKGGLQVPRFEHGNLVWPDGLEEPVSGLHEALTRNLVIVSRELARLPQNREFLLSSPRWDLVLLDESHAARRARQEETEFNSATLLLELLRRMQLTGATRSFLLLSATPMQTHPWEPFDLLQVLGEGGEWLADFGNVRTFYGASAALTRMVSCSEKLAERVATLVAEDGRFDSFPGDGAFNPTDRSQLAQVLSWSTPEQRPILGRWLHSEGPLSQRMHRNTRDTLREYYRRGLIGAPPPQRIVTDVRFDYDSPSERDVYEAVGAYIERRFTELEQERPGKGFVMTIYRRRTASSARAIKRSLERRKEGLLKVIAQVPREEELDPGDLPAEPIEEAPELLDEQGAAPKISLSLPEDPETARQELADVERLLSMLDSLAGTDSKRDRFFQIHDSITRDGRPILVFTEAVDTLEYLRDAMLPWYGTKLATYSGRGGELWTGSEWKAISKQAVTEMLAKGEIGALVCNDAASEGLNLQAAGALINYDLPWNPSRVEQRIGRVDRIGQKYPEVFIVNMFLKDSVDDRVYQVLEERCGLFKHFVGSMQPVLAEARRILLGRGGSLDSLRASAGDVQEDALALAIYEPEAADEMSRTEPALTAEQLLTALADLKGVEARTSRRTRETVKVESRGEDKLYSISEAELDLDKSIQPLSTTSELVHDLRRSLKVEGSLLPLVVEAASRGPFRAAAASWVQGDGSSESVESLSQLEDLIAGWDASTPDRDALERARLTLREQVGLAAANAEARAAEREIANLQAQIDAARGRLARELCRYLLVRYLPVLPDGTWLNNAIYAELGRTGPVAVRFQRAFELLGGYPDWHPTLIDQVAETVATFNENRRNSVLSLTSVDAALADPRWQAMLPQPE